MKLLSACIFSSILLATACVYLPATSSGSIGQLPVIASFEASPNVITDGERSELAWNVTGANTVTIDNGIGPVALRGMRTVTPATTTVYLLTASGASGSSSATAQVVVKGASALLHVAAAPVINWFSCRPAAISPGGTSELSWNVSNATSVSINPGIGAVTPLSGSRSVSPQVTTGYTLTAQNSAGSTMSFATVSVSGVAKGSSLPVVNVFEAIPSTLPFGGSTSLKWDVSNASGVTIVSERGSMLVGGLVGSANTSPAATTTYTLHANNSSGAVSRTIIVTVGESGGGSEADLTGPSVPYLLTPLDGASLPQPSLPWNFDWSDSTDPDSVINSYQIYVTRPGAAAPAVDTYTPVSNYAVILGGVIGPSELVGWAWQVRTQNKAGLWSEWSAARTFRVQSTGITVNLNPVANETGTVYKDGTAAQGVKFAGDTSGNMSMRCLFSYDITALSGKTIESARLTFSTNSIVRNPYGNLGSLSVGRINYGTGMLEPADYGVSGTSMASVTVPPGELDVTTYVKNAVLNSDPRFQVRLQFANETNGDSLADYITFNNAVLTVTYSN